ncbi:perlucin-like protein [Rhineura floridana]|uniref:perlucin-like protein n=1 Tax=Rhineura floridana TaxID=261503 RepID=UPI002AC87FDA|nr:perlucin-like protein [Rhineura floridana]
MVVNLSDYYINLTLRNDELQLEIDDVREKVDSGWKIFRWNVYFFSKDLGTWSESIEKCKEKKSDLVSVLKADEQLYLNTEVRKNKFCYWIGLRKNKKKRNGVLWLNGMEATTT